MITIFSPLLLKSVIMNLITKYLKTYFYIPASPKFHYTRLFRYTRLLFFSKVSTIHVYLDTTFIRDRRVRILLVIIIDNTDIVLHMYAVFELLKQGNMDNKVCQKYWIRKNKNFHKLQIFHNSITTKIRLYLPL